MAETTQVLRDLHRYHIQLADVASRLKRGPVQVRIARERVDERLASQQAAKDDVMQSRKHCDEKELQLKEREAKIADLKAKLNACNSNREYQAFLEQIAAHEQANSVLSDEILEGYDKIQELEEKVKLRDLAVAQERAELEGVEKRVADEKDSLESDLARLTDELGDVEQRLPSEIRGDFLRLAKVRAEESLASVEADICQGCYQRITPQMSAELHQQRHVICKSCGRWLYLPEERRVGG